MRLAWKINGALILVISSVLVLQAWLRLNREHAWLDAEMRRDHHVLGRAVRPAIEDDWRTGGQDAAVALASRLGIRDEGVRVRIVWPAETGSDRAPDVQGAAREALAAAAEVSITVESPAPGWRYTYVALDPDVTTLALIELRETQAPVEAFTDQTTVRVATWLGLLVLVTALAVAVLVDLLVVRPVRALSAHAQRIAEGHLDARVGATTSDELGVLSGDLDRMAADLASASERLQAEQKSRERAQEQLRHADRLMSVGQLAAGVAHELGTPLNVALVRARMIERGQVESPEEAQSFAGTIAGQCERMAVIIRQLLGFARPAAPSLAPTQVRVVVDAVFLLLAPTARSANITLSSEFLADPILPLDAHQFEQVMLNLLTNAMHATPRGGQVSVLVDRARITAPPGLGSGEPCDWIAVVVQDNGTGIAPDNLSRVFEPFFTTKDVGQGTGLGLSVSHGIVREHGGWIDVDSALGQGARFTIYLPWRDPRSSPDST